MNKFKYLILIIIGALGFSFNNVQFLKSPSYYSFNNVPSVFNEAKLQGRTSWFNEGVNAKDSATGFIEITVFDVDTTPDLKKVWDTEFGKNYVPTKGSSSFAERRTLPDAQIKNFQEFYDTVPSRFALSFQEIYDMDFLPINFDWEDGSMSQLRTKNISRKRCNVFEKIILHPAKDGVVSRLPNFHYATIIHVDNKLIIFESHVDHWSSLEKHVFPLKNQFRFNKYFLEPSKEVCDSIIQHSIDSTFLLKRFVNPQFKMSDLEMMGLSQDATKAGMDDALVSMNSMKSSIEIEPLLKLLRANDVKSTKLVSRSPIPSKKGSFAHSYSFLVNTEAKQYNLRILWSVIYDKIVIEHIFLTEN